MVALPQIIIIIIIIIIILSDISNEIRWNTSNPCHL